MFLEALEKKRALPRTLSQDSVASRERARARWADFVERLRKPRSLDARFFLIVESDSKITYLDQVSWFESRIAGRDAIEQEFRCFPEDLARESVLDYGYLENGLLQESHWLRAVYFQENGGEGVVRDFVLPTQLELSSELYEHYLAIALHDRSAIDRLAQFSLAEAQRVPFQIDFYGLEEFCPLGYAVAYNTISGTSMRRPS